MTTCKRHACDHEVHPANVTRYRGCCSEPCHAAYDRDRYESALRRIVDTAPDEEPDFDPTVHLSTEEAEAYGFRLGWWEAAELAREELER